MHDEFVVADDQALETESFNSTKAAIFGNAGNVIVAHDPTTAVRYAEEWQRLWNHPSRW
jgi:phosphatidylserine/phosphatidylglycerophosphate/cardiolipin synthase-like enzyme